MCLRFSPWYILLRCHKDAMVCISAIWELQRLKTPALKITLFANYITPKASTSVHIGPSKPSILLLLAHLPHLQHTHTNKTRQWRRPAAAAQQYCCSGHSKTSWRTQLHPVAFPSFFFPLSATTAQLCWSSHSFAAVIGATPTALEWHVGHQINALTATL